MRILFVTERPYLPQQIGGREMVIHESIQELLKSGDQAFVMSGLQPGTWLSFRNRLISKITKSEYAQDSNLNYQVFRGWNWRIGLEPLIARLKPDVAVVESTSLDLLHKIEELGVPAVLRLHDSAVHVLGKGPLSCRPTQVIAVSNFLADRFEQQFSIRPVVIPPLVRRERCVTKTTRSSIVLVNPRIIKGGDTAIEIARECADIPFIFFHGWTLDDDVRELVRISRQVPNIHWHPSVMDAREIYKNAHSILIPSKGNETWGRVATEAHFNAIPVIASRRGGLVESVGTGGILLEPNASLTDWIAAVRRLWDDQAFYRKMSEDAILFSDRRDVSPTHLMSKFRECLNAEIARKPG